VPRVTLLRRRALIGILVVAAAARVGIIIATPHFAAWGDPADYQRQAVSIAAGQGFAPTPVASPGTPSAFRPPAYPYLLGAAYAIVGVHPLAGRLLGALLGVLTVALIAYVGEAIWDRRIGLIAAALAAVFPPLVMLDATLLSESLFVPLSLAFILSLLACRRHPASVRWALAAGFLCALATLTRVVADLWLLVALAVVTIGAAKTARWWRAVAVLGAFILTLAPWTIRNFSTFHTFIPVSTEGGYTMAGQYNDLADQSGPFEAVWQAPLQAPSVKRSLAPTLRKTPRIDEAHLDSALRRIAVNYMLDHPSHLLTATWLDSLRLIDIGKSHGFVSGISYRELNVPSGLRSPMSWSAQLVVALALLALTVRALGVLRYRLGPAWLWALPILALAVTVPVVGNPVKRIPLDPFLLLLAALALASLADWTRARQPTR
jgi:4-amino-4-deoxy-L-arabinose transferase-like glycosyltransferase